MTFQGEEPVDTGGSEVFSFDATSGLTRRLWLGAGAIFELCAQLLWCELR